MDKSIPEYIRASDLPEYHQDHVVLLDIRDQASFTQNHLPGAVWMIPDELVANIDTMDKNKHYIIICYHGISAVAVANYMRQFDLQASVLKDGMAAFARF
ncbi:MAG: rhodanese-like domain-containing protein [Gammaproteobacteria bacterium]|nr:rhodanese-like domain-containing protein [Gammaproteobacteria bacterium]